MRDYRVEKHFPTILMQKLSPIDLITVSNANLAGFVAYSFAAAYCKEMYEKFKTPPVALSKAATGLEFQH